MFWTMSRFVFRGSKVECFVVQHQQDILKNNKLLAEIVQFEKTEKQFLAVWEPVFGPMSADIEFLRYVDFTLIVGVKKSYLNYEVTQHQAKFLDKLKCVLPKLVVKRIKVRYYSSV